MGLLLLEQSSIGNSETFSFLLESWKFLSEGNDVKLLFGFCAELIPDKEMLKETYDLASNRQSMSVSMAPILGAFGQNYEDVYIAIVQR